MAMRKYSANMPPPDKRSLIGNVTNNWRTFKRNFLNNSIASRLSKEADIEYQTSVCLVFLVTIV